MVLQKTQGIVLRSLRYGETSLISHIFTRANGVQSFMVQGVRTSSQRSNKAALLQPASLLELVVYHKEQKTLHRLREFHSAYIYQHLQEEVVRNAVALFSVELILKLLPEQARQPELFDLSYAYFQSLDQLPLSRLGNLPLWFVIQCSNALGYELSGRWSEATPHLHLQEGGFSSGIPSKPPFIDDEAAKLLSQLLEKSDPASAGTVEMNAIIRNRLLDWYLEFLHQHSQHLGSIKSLPVLRAILH